jgi:hypothetical protein
MAIESWIDDIVRVAGSVASHKGGKVRAYLVAEKAEFPEALSVYPCVLVYPVGVKMQLSSSMSKEIWSGVMEFYLFPDVKKSNIPTIVRYFKRIRDAMSGKLTLGGKVNHFIFSPDDTAMEFSILTYGDETPRHGISVRWQVKSDVSSEVTVSG